jgi:hypothetical protein
MSRLSTQLYHRCRNTFLECHEFDSNASLKAVFVTSDLRPFRNRIPDTGSKTERVEACLALLIERYLSDGRAVLPLFVAALRDRYTLGDALHDELEKLAREVSAAYTEVDEPFEGGPSKDTLQKTGELKAQSSSKHQPQPPTSTIQIQDNLGEREPPEQKNSTGQNLILLATGVLGFLTGVLGNLFAAWIQQDVLRNTFTWISIISIILLTIAGLIAGVLLQRFTRPIQIKRSVYWWLTAVVTGVVILVLFLAWQSVIEEPPKPPTVYYVIDATEKMAPLFDEVLDLVQMTISTMPNKAKIGLRVYGGQLSGVTGCSDTKQLLKLNTYENISATLDTALLPIEPRGNGGLTGAMLETLYGDLAKETEPIRILIITSGVDYQCELPESGILESRANDLGSKRDITIFSIGNLDPRTEAALNSYAAAFKGKHFNRNTPDDLRPAIETFVNYGSNYLVEHPPTPPAQ